jgi:HlyD family secretion protein
MSTLMDRPIEPSLWHRYRRWLGAIAAMTTIGFALFTIGPRHTDRNVRIPIANLTIAQVRRGVFHDFIPLRAAVVPRDTVYLDALEGGRVEQVLVEPGDIVAARQPLVRLSNTELELEVLDREGRLIESITQLQAYETQLEQNRLANTRALCLIDYNIIRLDRAIKRRKSLAERGLVAQEDRDTIQDELDYNIKLRPMQAQSNAQQDDLRLQQLPQIRSQLQKLQQDVEITRSKLENLTVRSPVAGRMTAIDLKVGDNRNRGERFGEITPETGYKLSADVDEFYLGRLRTSVEASAQIGDRPWKLRLTRIYPQVKDGTFKIDLAFDGEMPSGLLPGEAVQGRLSLGNDTAGFVLPTGAFLERTGGDWIFVLAPDRATAQRRRIRIGRRNADQVEVLNGLSEGNEVITSDYTGLERIDRVDLTR